MSLRVVHLPDPPWLSYVLTCDRCGKESTKLLRMDARGGVAWLCPECREREKK